jgi:serine/threonine protein kinase
MALRIESGAEPIPGYKLIERLGGGGFGEVWRAEAPGGLHKAIKFVYGDLSGASENGMRAEQELKALSRVKTVRHPYILSLERYDIIDGRLLIVMELADRNLWDRFKECRAQGLPGIPREELLRYMEESAEALDLMNQDYQLQHLDIKPQNLFLIHQHIKVADFGLVKDLEGSQASITGGVTPVYAAPETFDGTVSRYSDQYSLAIVYQELLTSQRPFQGANVRQLILQHLQGVPKLQSLPPAEQPIIQRALSKQPDERFPSCRSLVAALRAASEPPSPGPSPAHSSPINHHQAPLSQPPTQPALLGGSGAWPVLTPPPHTGALVAPVKGAQAETGSSQGITQVIRAPGPTVQKAEPGSKAPPEVSGPGSLFPTLVIGLGQIGLSVLQSLRDHIQTTIAPMARIPSFRMLLIDTDPEIMRTATRGKLEAALTPNEVLLIPLNRPAWYLKPRDGRPPLAKWLNPRMLYRIPRSQVTTGVRALGRLAFLDNYRPIVRRLQMELDTILEPAALQAAARQSEVGLRTNRPRVYLITALGGGTGSGMFLDVAYTLRTLLRQMGYDPVDVVGLLLLPPVDKTRSRGMTLGNVYAALAELTYYAAPGTSFHAQYHEREAPIQDDGPPFSRSLFLQLPDETDEIGTQEMVELSAQFLARDLASPLGRSVDLARAGLPSAPWESRGLYFSAFGLYQLTWPRHALLSAIARQLCQQLVQLWMTKDAKPLEALLREHVQNWWQTHELSADAFIRRIHEEVTAGLGQSADSLFEEILEPFRTSANGPASRGSARDGRPVSAEQIAKALAALEEPLGTPSEEATLDDTGKLVRLIRGIGERLSNEWSQKLAELPASLIEEPGYRLAGAEEAIRQAGDRLEQALQHHEPLACELTRKAGSAFRRVQGLLEATRAGKQRPTQLEVGQGLLEYAKNRFQSLILNRLIAAFVGLRGHLSDEVREVNFCRLRLGELLRMLEQVPPGAASSRPSWAGARESGLGQKFFQHGCRSVEEAVQQFLQEITLDHLHELDGKMEEMLKSQFTALINVCLTNANILKNVELALLETAREYAAAYLPNASMGELFYQRYPQEGEALAEIGTWFDEAAPDLAADERSPRQSPAVGELCVLATPTDEASLHFRESVRQALPNTEVIMTDSTEDIIFYRERINLAVEELEQFGPVAREAYVQMATSDNFTPHSRIDVNFRVE